MKTDAGDLSLAAFGFILGAGQIEMDADA